MYDTHVHVLCYIGIYYVYMSCVPPYSDTIFLGQYSTVSHHAGLKGGDWKLRQGRRQCGHLALHLHLGLIYSASTEMASLVNFTKQNIQEAFPEGLIILEGNRTYNRWKQFYARIRSAVYVFAVKG